MELYLPPTYAKLHQGTEFKECSSEYKARSKANRESAIKYWSDKHNHERVSPTAKAVDVFDLQGRYIATYPSSRKAAEALFPDKTRSNAERNIRGCRVQHRQNYRKLQYCGYQFRNATEEKRDIGPIPKRRHKTAGYHCNRKCKNDYFKKQTTATMGDTTLTFDSVKECAEALQVSLAWIYKCVANDMTCRGWIVKYDYNPRIKPIY
jgi:hypothetical protein